MCSNKKTNARKENYILAFLFLAVAFVPNFANAASVSQLDSSVPMDNFGGGFLLLQCVDISSLGGTLRQIHLIGAIGTTTPPLLLNMQFNAYTTTDCSAGAFLATTTNQLDDDELEINTNKDFVTFDWGDNNFDISAWGSLNVGLLRDSGSAEPLERSWGNGTDYFYIVDNDGLSSPTTTVNSSVIQIVEPTQATTTTITTVDIEIDYFNTGNADVLTLFLWDRVTSQQVILPVFDFPINTGVDTATTTLEIEEGSYKLQAVLFSTVTGSQFGNIISVDFNVLSDVVSEIFGVDIYDPDDLLALATTTCSFTNITGCFQNALVFAFVPAEDSFNRFVTLKDQLINKPPFGYFALLASGLSGLNSTSTPAFVLATEDNIVTNIFDPIKTGLSWLLWVFFGVWLYKRVIAIAL